MTHAPEWAFDLRYATDHFTGIGTHAYGLARALVALPGEERWRLIWGKGLPCSRFSLEGLQGHPRVDWVETDVPPLGWRTAVRTGALLRRLGGRAYLSPFWLLPERVSMPVVLTVHDVLPLAEPWAMSWWRRRLYQLALDGAAGAAMVIASSEFTRGEIARRTRIRADRVRVVPPGLATPSNECLRPKRAPEGPFALVVGVNKRHKNLRTVADAFAALSAPAPALVWAGYEDPRWPGLTQLAPASVRVTALGRASAPELEWLYRNAAVVLFPTRYEGFGLPLLEAAARGTPVVASDIPALREVGDGLARFVPPLDVAAWTRAIADAFADPEARARQRSGAPALAARYDYARCAERTLAVLREVTTLAAVC